MAGHCTLVAPKPRRTVDLRPWVPRCRMASLSTRPLRYIGDVVRVVFLASMDSCDMALECLESLLVALYPCCNGGNAHPNRSCGLFPGKHSFIICQLGEAVIRLNILNGHSSLLTTHCSSPERAARSFCTALWQCQRRRAKRADVL